MSFTGICLYTLFNWNHYASDVKPHSHCADVATVHPDAGIMM